MRNQMRNILTSQKQGKENGIAMIVVLLMVVVLMGLVVAVTSFAIIGLEKGKDVQALTAGSNAADSAISHALSLANSKKGQSGNGLEQHIGVGKAVYGSVEANVNDPVSGDGQYLWRWYTERIAGDKEGLSYDIYATGYLNTPDDDTARSFKVRVTSTVVESASYMADGTPVYAATEAGMFGWGAFGLDSTDVKQDAKVQIYDSAKNISYPTTAIKKGTVSTNGTMSFGTGVSLDRPFFFGAGGTSFDTARCTGAFCTAGPVTTQSYSLSLKSAADIVKKACPLTSYPNWVASANSGTVAYSASPKCYNNITFDVDTNVPLTYSSGAPAVMMAKGNITVNPGVEVNRQLSSSQGPLALRIYSQAGTSFVMERGTQADPTKMTAVVAGPALLCSVGKNVTYTVAHDTTLLGSMACRKSTIERGSTVWWDSQIDQVTAEGSSTAKKLWSISTYQEI